MGALLGASWLSVWACTLSGAGYEPGVVAGEPLGPGPEAVPDAASADGGGCAPGLDCCELVACSGGQLCVAGRCTVPSVPVPDAGCEGSDCPGSTPVVLAPSCDDGERNGDETDLDCGGSCVLRCALDAGCALDSDCVDGLSCLPETSRCAEPACDDDLLNGDELAEDCGGGTCPGCADGSPCNEGSDCESRVCGGDGTCAAPACDDGQGNGDETGVDCGGSCPANCGNGGGCEGDEDCQSGVCDDQGCDGDVERCCQAPSCDDEVRNGGESDVDCGTFACGDCGVGDTCQANAQCTTNSCIDGVCAALPTCTDNLRNGTETGVDCGGTCPNNCPDLSGCAVDGDCTNNNCLDGVCISCGDNQQNGTETDVDCGGADPACRRCNPGESCASNTDCVSQFCLGGVC